MKSIKEHTFAGCKGLTSVTIPDSVTLIEEEAFYGCTNLESIKFEENSQLTYIDINAFRDCTSLKRVIIPQGVERIKAQAFCNCTELESVEIPNSISSIGYGTFNDCTSLESVFLPDGLDVTNAKIPDATSQVRYSLDTERGEVTITGIELETGKTGVAIPATICGYPVVAVVESEQSKVGAHTCNPREVIKSNALKTAGTCQSQAVYYYSCGICGKVYSGGNTFNGEKDSNNHTGTKKWIQNEKQHKQYWNCCDAVVVDYVDHNWNSGVCSVCDYVCKHTGGEATCTNKAKCEYCGAEYGELDSSNHRLENIHANDATVTETGNIEYWQCENCKECFSDKDGKNSIDIADTVTKKLQPEIIEGMDQIITAGEKKALSFTSNAAFEDFKSVTLDCCELSEEYYEKAEGSIIITLDADYVATLLVGEHTIGIVSESGTATTTFTVAEKAASGTSDDSDKDSKADKDSAKTGDDANLALWLALMLLSGAGITGVTVYTRRKRTNE